MKDDVVNNENTLPTDTSAPNEHVPVEKNYNYPPQISKIKSEVIKKTNANGGSGIWKYKTEHRGTDHNNGKVQFFTVWSTPTKKESVPRATAGVWFVYEKGFQPNRKVLIVKIYIKGFEIFNFIYSRSSTSIPNIRLKNSIQKQP